MKYARDLALPCVTSSSRRYLTITILTHKLRYSHLGCTGVFDEHIIQTKDNAMIQQIYYFQAVVRNNSFSETAEEHFYIAAKGARIRSTSINQEKNKGNNKDD